MPGGYKTRRTYRSGNTYTYYKIYWRPRPNKVKSREWSVKKYGDEQAFRLACEFRDKVMKQIHGERYEQIRGELVDKNVLQQIDKRVEMDE